MAIPKIIGAQRDFSAGEVDVALKRADESEARKRGARQLSNWRILNAGNVQDRPGRSLQFPISNGCTRVEEFTISPGNTFKIAFGSGRYQIITSAGVVVLNRTMQGNGVAALPWTLLNLNSVDYAILGLSLYMTFPGMRPQVVTFDGVSAWSVSDYNELVTAGGQKRTPFYRISPKNITLQPSGTSGAITVGFSSPIVVPGMQGTRVRYAGRQILLGAPLNGYTMNATVVEALPPSQSLALSGAIGNFAVGDVVLGSSSGAAGIIIQSPNQQSMAFNFVTGTFNVGDTIIGATSGATGVVTNFYVSGSPVVVATISGTAFVVGEIVTGPSGSGPAGSVSTTALLVQPISQNTSIRYFATSEVIASSSATATVSGISTAPPQAISLWDEEVMNSFRGFPASVFVDQFRVGFCNFPAVPGGIGWSAINSPTDLYVDGSTANAMFEIAPEKVQVYFVVPGPESSEFVFTDKKIYYIPISASNPLKPGSVSFQILSDDGAAQVRPRGAGELIFYAGSGSNSIKAIIATGAYLRPFNTRNVTAFHSHLFSNISAIAAPTADSTFTERYVYVLNADGTMVCGKYALGAVEKGDLIGWGPWSGSAAVSWIAAWNADVLFTSSYFNVLVCEVLDDTKYLDGAMFINAAPAAFAPPFGKGPLWWIAGQSVSLMDQVTRSMGTYQIDANGFIVPQFNAGENLAVASLIAGQPWTSTLEPFVPDADPGKSVSQRMFRRRVSRFKAYVSSSTGFLFARLFSGPLRPGGPALGTVMKTRRVTTYRQGDDPTLPPPLREEAPDWRPLGRSFDARVALIKDTPGPLMVHEIGLEASI